MGVKIKKNKLKFKKSDGTYTTVDAINDEHSHDNKSVLDSITSDEVSAWNHNLDDVSELNADLSHIENLEYTDLKFSITVGKFVKFSTGEEVTDSSTKVSDFIDISNFSKIQYSKLCHTGNSTTLGMAFYDENKTYMSGSCCLVGASSISYIDSIEVVPSNAKYVRISGFVSISGDIYCKGITNVVASVTELNEYSLKQYYNKQNLFDKNDEGTLTTGYYSDGTTFNKSTTLGQSAMIPVEEGEFYAPMQTNVFVLYYDANESYIGKINASILSSNGCVEMPKNACYARFIFTISQIDIFYIYHTDSKANPIVTKDVPTSIPIAEVIDARGSYDTLGERLDVIENDYSEFYGKSGVAFGTSLTYRAQTTGGYLQYLPTLSGMTFENQGIGGATILKSGTLGCILEQVKAYTDYSSKNVCILEGFVNDFYTNPSLLGEWDDSDETTVCGCVRSALDYIMTQNANITVFLVLDPYGQNYSGSGNSSSTYKNTAGLTQYEYYEEIAKVAESLGVTVIKEYAESEINEYHPQYLIDNIHPSALGAEQSAKCIWSGMKKRFLNVVS